MAKLKFQPDPTFELPVSLPVAGQEEKAEAVFTVKYLSYSQVDNLFSAAKEGGGDNVNDFLGFSDFARQVVTGWNIDKEFNADNLNRLLDNYPNLAEILCEEYFEEYYKARRKN